MDNLNLALCRINWGANVVNSEYKIKKILGLSYEVCKLLIVGV